jgi:autotransporter-associated beta strand protein/T5SS/PEP-CTERM-associated repeat protein
MRLSLPQDHPPSVSPSVSKCKGCGRCGRAMGSARRKAAYLVAMALASTFMGSRTYAAQLAGVLGAHDPSNVMKDGSQYWYFATGQGIISRTSTDLVNWNAGPSVFDTQPAWTTQAVPSFTGFFWAPSVSFFNNQYYLYYAVSEFGTIDSAIGVATSPSLSTPTWTDLGKVVQSDPVGQTSPNTDTTAFNAIDPSILVDTDGKVWMSFGSYSSGILVTQIDPTTGKRLNTSTLSATLVANNASGGGWGSSIEASSLIKHGSFYYLFVNYGGCCAGIDSTYNIRVGRSTSPTGPFVDQNGIDMRNGGGTLFLGDNGNKIGPGQFGYYTEAGQDYFSYHYYDGNANGAPTFDMRDLYWTSDAWPSTAAVSPNWLGATSSNWSDVTNWTVAGVPNAAGNIANFSGNTAARYSVNIDGGNKTVGTLNFTSTSSYTIGTNAGNALTLHALSGDSDTINVSAGSHTIAAPLTAADNLSINIFTSTTLSMSGSITAPSLAKYGLGNLSLSGSSTYSGTVLEHAGTLDITGSVVATGYTSIAPGAGDTATMTLRGTSHYTSNNDFNVGDTGDSVTLANGTLNLTGSATLTVGTGGGFYVGSGFFAGTQSTGTVNQTGGTLTAGGNFDGAFIIGGRGSALATGTYNLSAGTVNANTDLFVGGMGTGTIVQTGGTFNANVFASIGRFSGAIGAYTISGGTLNQTSTTTNLIVGESGKGTLTLNGSASAALSATLTLGKNSTGNGTVTLNGGTLTAPSIGGGAGSATFDFNGGTLHARASTSSFMQGLTNAIVQTGGAVIDTQSFTISIAQPLLHDPTLGSARDGGITKLGAGTLTLTGANTFTGNTSINAGQLIFAAASTTITSATGNGTLHVASNASLISDGINTAAWLIDGTQTIRTNTTTTGTSKITTLTLAGSTNAWTGSLDLKNNALILEPPDALSRPTAITTLQNQIAFGSTHTAGIRSSTLPGNMGLALLDNTLTQFSTFHGASVDPNSLLIAPELLGDANADGTVNLTDLNTVLAQLGTTTLAWTSGNFDHAATIDLTDLNDVLNNLGATFTNANVAAPTPEPASLAILTLGGALLPPRKRKT